jgi:phospho-N-acetylmuramoyl-pentapeptide-transferase
MPALDPTTINTIAIFAPTVVAFFIGMLITPAITDFLYENEMWKPTSGKITPDGREAKIFNKLHKDKEVGTPRMGGAIIWIAVLLTTALFTVISTFDGYWGERLNFFSRSETWLPLFTLLAGAGIGLIDDWFEISGADSYLAGGLSLKKRLAIVGVMGAIGAWWFYAKLGVSSVFVPLLGSLPLGWLFIPFFIIVMLAVYSTGIIDGIDGLSGGVFATSFTAYGIIAFASGLVNLATLCFVIVGGILAFLWFNIPPARFYMTETGTMALTTTLAVIAFLTDQVLVLLIIGFPLVATTASNIIQLLSVKFRGKKVFQVAPLHHHFEAIGWSGAKVTMRYWVVSIVCAISGTIIALLSL